MLLTEDSGFRHREWTASLQRSKEAFKAARVVDCGLAYSAYNGDGFGYSLELLLIDSNDR